MQHQHAELESRDLPAQSLTRRTEREKLMSLGSVSTPSSSNRPTRWGYVVRLYTCWAGSRAGSAARRPGRGLPLGHCQTCLHAFFRTTTAALTAHACREAHAAPRCQRQPHLEPQVNRVPTALICQRVSTAFSLALKKCHAGTIPATKPSVLDMGGMEAGRSGQQGSRRRAGWAGPLVIWRRFMPF